jgi:broad specificity phosphatase PhoE
LSRLFLVRHAQASFLEPNYDKLSTTGETQARLLGQYWARHNVVFDRVFSGPRVRQERTAQIAGEACRDAGARFPQPAVMKEFDEYAGDAVLEQALPRLLQSDNEIRKLRLAFESSPDSSEKLKHFQRMFEAVIGKWVGGEIPLPDVESWPEFCARVHRGLSQLISDGRRGGQVAIFCSGGPISVAMQHALNLSPQDTLRVAWMVRNCSYSEFLCSGERFTLSTFNSFPHLDDAALLTYR